MTTPAWPRMAAEYAARLETNAEFRTALETSGQGARLSETAARAGAEIVKGLEARWRRGWRPAPGQPVPVHIRFNGPPGESRTVTTSSSDLAELAARLDALENASRELVVRLAGPIEIQQDRPEVEVVDGSGRVVSRTRRAKAKT